MMGLAQPGMQPIGFHLGLSGDWLVTAISANAGDFLGHDAAAALGQPVTALFSSEAIHDIRNRMALLRSEDSVEHLYRFRFAPDGPSLDLAVYRNGGGFGIDGEACAERGFGDATGILQGMLSRIGPSTDVRQLCDRASHQLRALTGFQHVVISAGPAQLGQSMRAGLQPIDPSLPPLGPDMVVFDRDAAAVPINAVDTDWTMPRHLALRSPTGAERAALEQIDASAAVIVPLDRDGQAWGSAACYHGSPRHVGAERRNIARLFAEIVSLKIEIAELRCGA